MPSPVPMLLSHYPLRISVFLFLLLIFHAISASVWSSWQLAMVWPRRRGQGRQAPSLLPHHATGWPLYWLCSATSWPGRKVRIQAVTFSTKTVPFHTHMPVPNGTVSILNLNARSQEMRALEPCREGIVPFRNNCIVCSFCGRFFLGKLFMQENGEGFWWKWSICLCNLSASVWKGWTIRVMWQFICEYLQSLRYVWPWFHWHFIRR